MSNILAGLFDDHSDYKKLEADLENSGFDGSEYIVYLNGEEKPSQYLVSVAVKNNDQTDLARNIFIQNAGVKTYLFENMEIGESDYATIKRFIETRNKAEIHNAPDVRIKGATTGMDSEVRF